METITEIVEQKDFIRSVTSILDNCKTYDEIIEQTDLMEKGVERCKELHQWWHGEAYSKLKTPKQKEKYRKRYGLKEATVKEWASTVRNCMSVHTLYEIAKDDRLVFEHARAVKPLLVEASRVANSGSSNAKRDSRNLQKRAKKLLEEAIEGTEDPKTGERKPLAASVIKNRVTRYLNSAKKTRKKTVWEVCEQEAKKIDKLLIEVQKSALTISGSLESDPKIKEKLANMGLAHRFIHCTEILAQVARKIEDAKTRNQIGEN